MPGSFPQLPHPVPAQVKRSTSEWNALASQYTAARLPIPFESGIVPEIPPRLASGTEEKLLAERRVSEVPIRKLKKFLKKSSERKLGELVSYKAELLNSIRVLVPKQRVVDALRWSPVESYNKLYGASYLCQSCALRLRTYLLFSPVSRSPYLYEQSVPSYLALIDDARRSAHSREDMEAISHDELSSILQAELSVVEWRLSLKLARFHQKTGYLSVFPMEIGEYADLEIKRALNKPGDGILTTVWKKLRTAT